MVPSLQVTPVPGVTPRAQAPTLLRQFLCADNSPASMTCVASASSSSWLRFESDSASRPRAASFSSCVGRCQGAGQGAGVVHRMSLEMGLNEV